MAQLYSVVIVNNLLDPEVNVMVPDITVPEGDPNVTICIILSTGITEQVIVTAVTGPKSGAANPATGKPNYITMNCSSGMQILYC